MTRTDGTVSASAWHRTRRCGAMLRARGAAVRARVRAMPSGRLVWRVGITLAGVAVIVVGVVLLPLPGPGWLIIFAGLGLLATEYPWAARLLSALRDLVARWTDWLGRQRRSVQVVAGVSGVLFLVAVLAGVWYLYRLM